MLVVVSIVPALVTTVCSGDTPPIVDVTEHGLDAVCIGAILTICGDECIGFNVVGGTVGTVTFSVF